MTDPGRDGVAIARRATSAAEVGRRETWHRAGGRSGTLRAVIFGVSDGLVSNLSLVMGVAGAASGNPSFILLAGIAGLLAGAFSMAAGEYISMQSQRELFERQIALERAEMEAMPEEEEAELAAVYRAKGFTAGRGGADRPPHLRRTRTTALDMLVREELGLDPDELGSPWGAAAGSFVAFAIGAVIPVIPYLFGGGTGRPARQPRAEPRRAVRGRRRGQPADRARPDLLRASASSAIGLAAALVTYAIGSIIGVGGRGLSRWPTTLARRLRAEGLDPVSLVERTGRPVRRPRARLRQGHRRRARLDPVRAARRAIARSSSATGDRLELPAGTAPRRRRRTGRRDLPRGASAGAASLGRALDAPDRPGRGRMKPMGHDADVVA